MSRKLIVLSAILLLLSGCQSTNKLTKVSCDFVSGAYESDIRQRDNNKSDKNVRKQNIANGVIDVIVGLLQDGDKKSNECTNKLLTI